MKTKFFYSPQEIMEMTLLELAMRSKQLDGTYGICTNRCNDCEEDNCPCLLELEENVIKD